VDDDILGANIRRCEGGAGDVALVSVTAPVRVLKLATPAAEDEWV
jgi:hypothetical protein